MTGIDAPIDMETIEEDSVSKNSRWIKSCQPIIKVKNQDGGEDIHYSVVYESLPSEFEAVATRQLKESPSAREEGLCKLREYMKRKNIPAMKENLLLAVLRNCKFDIKKSETKLKTFNNTRMECIQLLLTLKMETIENIIDDMAFGMLPYRDKHGRVVFYTRPEVVNLNLYSVNDVGIIYLVSILFVLSYPLTTISGLSYFGDCKTDALYMFCDIFGAFRKYVFSVLSLPIRLSRIEILNENYMCKCFYAFMKTIISKKIIERVCLHGDSFDQLFQMYSPEILPKEFGGKAGPISNGIYREKLLNFIKDLRNQNL